MSESSDFVIFQRSDGSSVACQSPKILFVAKGETGTVLNFGGSTQVNVREDFDDVLGKLGLNEA